MLLKSQWFGCTIDSLVVSKRCNLEYMQDCWILQGKYLGVRERNHAVEKSLTRHDNSFLMLNKRRNAKQSKCQEYGFKKMTMKSNLLVMMSKKES